MKKWWISGLGVLALGGAAAMATPSYTAVFLPSPSGTNTYAEGIASNGQIVGYSLAEEPEALLWTTPYSSPVSLGPTGYTGTKAFATDGNLQAGYGTTATEGDALLWNGSAQSVVDLNPVGYYLTQINGIANGQEVGQGFQTSTSPLHALLWDGDDPNATDINPAGYSESNANGTNGVYQVGAGIPNSVDGVSQGSRALLWSGTAASAVDITPAGYADAAASKISGDLVVGSGSPGTGLTDALLWDLSNGTYTDLGLGVADSIAGNYEAGYRGNDAMVWTGSAASAVNLQSFLPSGYTYSVAYGVDADGDVVGAAGSYGQYQAVIWLAPEPTVILIAPVLALLARRGRSVR